MKAVNIYRKHIANLPHVPYPNAATFQDILKKVIDLLSVAAIGVGAATILLFILALG